MRILIIEDEKATADGLKTKLERECFAVDIARDGESGVFLATTNDYDLIILDYVLPKKNGYQVCEEIRLEGKTMPILMMTIRSAIDDKTKLLDAGADDYMVKPYHLQELMSRIRALLRRPSQVVDEILQVDDLKLDVRRQIVRRGNKDIYLTRKNFMILEYLMKNRGSVLSRGMIMEHVWDMNTDPFSKTLDTHILTLRRQINISRKKKLIHTVSGRGYKIDLVK